jgi:hypothetical protein
MEPQSNNPFSATTVPQSSYNNSADPYRSLSIASWGPGTLEDAKSKTINFVTRETNRLDDIAGARPRDKYTQFSQKYANFSTAELEPAQPLKAKPAIHGRNTRDLSLYIDDIEGTRCINKDRMALTKRRVNPLVPEYSLPASVPAPNDVPKFVRDEMFFDDIEGMTPKQVYAYHIVIGGVARISLEATVQTVHT